jgi:hypothetical protein
MSTNTTTMKGFVISSHPYAFDTWFVLSDPKGTWWIGAGRVAFHASGGGVNEVWALVEADDEGYAGLKEAGFDVRSAHKGRYVDSSGESYVVEEAGGAVRRESGPEKQLWAEGVVASENLMSH